MLLFAFLCSGVQAFVLPHVLVLACDRRVELDTALFALSKAYLASLASVTVSVDCIVDSSFYTMIHKYRQDFRTLSVQSSYQQHIEPDAWRDERVARHWISAVTRQFEDGANRVLYLEEDHVVMPDIFIAAHRFDRACEKCFAVNLACHKPCDGKFTLSPHSVGLGSVGNIAVLYHRKQWLEFVKYKAPDFCTMRGNWDINLAFFNLPMLQVYKPRAYHLHDCVSARRKRLEFGGKFCNKRRELYRSFANEWGQTTTSFSNVTWQSPHVVTRGRNAPAPKKMRDMCMRAAYTFIKHEL